MSSITSPREAARTQERAVQEDERRRLEFQLERTIKDDDLADSDEKKTPFPIPLKTFRSGVEIQMTSRIEVEENVAMGDGLRLGNSVVSSLFVSSPNYSPDQPSSPSNSSSKVL